MFIFRSNYVGLDTIICELAFLLFQRFLKKICLPLSVHPRGQNRNPGRVLLVILYFNFTFSKRLQLFRCAFSYLISAMRRDVVVEVSSRGMIKTGLKSDICQVSFTP